MAMLTVRQIDRADKDWLQKEAERQQLSMEALVRRLIHEKRQQSMVESKPSDIVRHYFGTGCGVELGARRRFGFDAPNLEDQDTS
jgi:hypothetical protein